MGRGLRTSATIKKGIEEDRKELELFFKKNMIIPSSTDGQLKESFRNAHKSVFTLCFWSTEFSSYPLYQRIFLDELRSDCLQSFPMALLGYKKPAALLLRSAIEDLLRHVYYFDHRIEFEKLENSPSSYERMSTLWQYLKTHPKLKDLVENTNVISQLENDYAVLSKSVHSTNTCHMSLAQSINGIVFEKVFFENYGKKINELSKKIHLILLCFSRKTIDSFNPNWLDFITGILPERYRKFI